MSAFGGKADITEARQICPLLTQSGHDSDRESVTGGPSPQAFDALCTKAPLALQDASRFVPAKLGFGSVEQIGVQLALILGLDAAAVLALELMLDLLIGAFGQNNSAWHAC